MKSARNETESFQVIVLPRREDARQAGVRIHELHTPDGVRSAAEGIDAVVIGCVETKAVRPQGFSHGGGRPDPILDFNHAVDTDEGDAQSFSVRVRAPKGPMPGVCEGKFEITGEGRAAFSFNLSVRV